MSSSQPVKEKVEEVVGKPVEEIQEDVKQAAKKSVSSLRDFAAGGVGGVCAVVVGHPFDLVKVRLQTAEKGVYSGAMDVVRKTIAREGPIRGLYAGVSAPLVGVTPMCGLKQCSMSIGITMLMLQKLP
jgi:solute carrier family 25 (mitochondrial carnitine/acylcarnitine transporter), member 20/29